MEENRTNNLDWISFIETKSERYMGIYEANKDKKAFVHTNWAAFFFMDKWMFYRKMYLWGAITMILQYVIAFALLIGMFALYLPEISGVLDAQAEAQEALWSQASVDFVFDGQNTVTEVQQELERELNMILYGKILFPVILIILLMKLVFSLFADCIYREHIRRNIGRGGDGVSILAVVIGVIAGSVVGDIVSAIAKAIMSGVLGI